jgi:formylglycine-generating enzyme required for sulfatase activity
MGRDPSFHAQCPDCPVERVSWNDVQVFLQKASQKNGKRYRLAFEAEWEWAAMGATLSKCYKYAGGNDPNPIAWFNIVQEKAHEVGTKRPNELGRFKRQCMGMVSGAIPAFIVVKWSHLESI